ncbi:hypothetical protein NUU61_005310 [Penicillium alfredii]|uniref:DUF1907 domain-containing protein n=1 Tax=Penicillium alfredii TaxID=1506179 RepID=A0A9W9K7H3_9EURO|nr:uncharacterized protein NUU61_005310 [Penicillium alfredii]KAJ5095954.1 hypothetical protein NUU61_005310 [Penicillium alfredii]
MSVTKHPRRPPPLTELAAVIERPLRSNFATATASVVQCPDLRQPPFHLAASGLSGNPCVADIGGQQNLFPTLNLNAKYLLSSLAGDMQIGVNNNNNNNTPDFNNTDSLKVTNGTRVIQINPKTQSPTCDPTPSTNSALMLNLYGSDVKPGPVLKITARARTGEKNFTNCILEGLQEVYGESQPVSLGGAFLLKLARPSSM